MASEKLLQFAVVMAFFLAHSLAGNFYQEVAVLWGDQRVQFQDGGQLLSLSLDSVSGSSVVSYNQYLYGRFDMQMKLVPGNSAGIITTFYLSSEGAAHDEIDFEFLGNSSGQPYTIHTNVFAQGVGNKEQQFLPWFDPTAAFHTYTILWNSQRIIFMVDNIPIRVFNNYAASNPNIPFPTSQAMKMYASIWDAEDWATQGGRVRTDWTQAPFHASYRYYNADACVVGNSCNSTYGWQTQGLDANATYQLEWFQKNYMIYNYCNDTNRPRLPECDL